jgi:chromosome segregation ATPase
MPAGSKQGSNVHTSKRPSSYNSLKKDATSRDVDKDEKIKSLKAENEAFSSNISKLQMSLKRSEDKVKQLDLRINELQYFEREASQVQNAKYELEQKYIKLENENKRLNTEILKLKRKTDDMYSLQSKLDRSEYDRRSLEGKIDQLKRHVYDLEEEKRKVRERKLIGKSLIFCVKNTSL